MKKWTLGLILIMLTTGPATAGVIFEVETTDHTQGEPHKQDIEVKAEGKNLTMGVPSTGERAQGAMIFRGDRREMVVVDHDNKSFIQMDEEAIQALAGQVDTAMSQIEEAMAKVPEKQRAMMEKLLQERMPPGAAQQPKRGPSSELRKTGESGERNGYPCVKYEVLRSGKKIREMWVTDWSNVEGGKEVADIFRDMSGFFESLMDSLPQSGSFGQVDSNIFELMKDLGGFPVVTREFDSDGSLSGESTLRSTRRQTIDPDAFEPPSGYKRQEMFAGP